MTFPPKVWDGVLTRLQKELPVVSFETWLLHVTAIPVDDGLELLCPNAFHRDRVRDYFLPLISRCLSEELGHDVPVRAAIANGQREAQGEGEGEEEGESERAHDRDATTPDAEGDSSAPRIAAPRGGEEQEPSISSTSVGAPSSTVSDAPSTEPRSGAQAPPWANDRRPQSGPNVFTLGNRGGKRRGALSQPGRRNDVTPLGRALDDAVKPLSGAIPRLGSGTRSPAHRSQGASPSSVQTPAQNHRQPRQRTFPLTFESFTVGPCNALAREAAFVIANPQQAGLDQLYIVSPSGLGKTHLARSVIDASRRSLGERARYTTAEAFTNEFTQSVQSNQMTRFKRRFRNDCDLLVVEDIQFLARKENTQLEFFHTVQHVLDCGGRVLLTGEKFPEELMELDPRLRARIASGLIAELDFPDAEVRRNILRAKAAHGGIRLPESCLDLLVDQIRGNVRELEGALIQLVATSSLLKRPIDVALAEESLLRRGRKPSLAQPRPTPEEIIKVVATFFQKPPEALASRSRRRDVLLPRQLAMYLCRRYTDASLAEIGRAMDRNHPSVANAIQNIERQVLEKVPLRYQVESLIARLDELGYKPIHGKF